MYCKNCGSEIANGAKFCSNCGSPAVGAPVAAAHEEPIEAPPVHRTESKPALGIEEEHRTPVFEEFQWNVEDYPDRETVGKTEDINFNWNANPKDVPEAPSIPMAPASETLKGADLERAVFGDSSAQQSPEPVSAADKIDKFYTFNKKNEEFQQLLNKEYQKVKGGNPIENEISQAESMAEKRFESRPVNATMEEFLASEGIVKPYQPKTFESDVLQKIEEQEVQREAARLEEEARLAAIEQARLESETQKKIEAEAARLEELAQQKAKQEAMDAEQIRLRAMEEARLRAQEAERLRAEEAARLRVETEARIKAEEEARLRAEADLRAAQEAAKIKAQQEARMAAEAEARYKATQDRQRFEEQEAQRRLEAERQRLSNEANEAVAQEEVRKALEQTARMRKEEEEKIRSAVAGIRSGGDMEQEAATAAAATVSPLKKEVAEAHKATKSQIDEMARARSAYFDEEFEDLKKQPPVTGRDTLLSETDLGKTRVVDKSAVLAGLAETTKVIPKEPIKKALSEDVNMTKDEEDFFSSLAITEPVATQQPKSEVPPPLDFEPVREETVDDLLNQFESINELDGEAVQQPMDTNPGLNDTVIMPHNDKVDEMPSNDFDNYGNEEAANYINQQEEQQRQTEDGNGVMDDFYGDDFYDDDEGLSKKEQKQRAKEQKRLEKQRTKEAKVARKRGDADFSDAAAVDGEREEKSGKGRVVLKVVLIILIVILAVEVVGMGIKFLAPQSKAAEIIDTQLNKVIQLITGEDTEYSVIAAQVRMEPMEDKTELITANENRNINHNVKSIVYNEELGYDQQRDGKVSDLVLSQPMTQVEWGRDKDNSPVYYDEEVVGEIIEFEARKVALMNKGNEKILSMIDQGSKLYSQTAGLKDTQMNGKFSKLEIGEIRQGGSTYYVWVRETIGDTSVDRVYSMYPEKKYVMKMVNCYEI
ncbi:MAG: zinc-ribbon domain-containing protein [Clostridiales bacterium]|nr:zinc-ribbon domain-containing protein [Clostridiales bacterium]